MQAKERFYDRNFFSASVYESNFKATGTELYREVPFVSHQAHPPGLSYISKQNTPRESSIFISATVKYNLGTN